MRELTEATSAQTTLAIGDLPIELRCESAEFISMVETQYRGFIDRDAAAALRLDVEVAPVQEACLDDELAVTFHDGLWQMSRGDFIAHWNPQSGRGRIRQSINPYSID